MIRIGSVVPLLALVIGSGVLSPGGIANAQQPPRPNIVFILMDDLRFDELGCVGHPFVKTPHIDRLAKEGAVFKNAFATTPLCSPSRACFMTGLYVHTNGIHDNVDRSPHSHALVTWPRLLHDAGYETAFIGKWHMGVDASPRPGFDHWVGVPGQGKYIDPDLNVDGKATQSKGYVTDIFNQHAFEFLKRPHAKPFCLFLAHKCVHPDLEQRADGSISDPNAATFLPAERHKKLYADEKPPRRPNAFEPPHDKPALMRKIDDLPPLSPATATDDETIRNRLRLLMAAEEGVGQILDALKDTSKLDNTLIVFTSDHGYFYGEHCLSVERRLAYEETIRIPLLIRYPPLIKPGTTFDQFVVSIDLAPTLLALGGARLPEKIHGRSFLPLLQGDQTFQPRTSILIEHFSDNVFARVKNMGYQAVRTDRWKYIH
ncbi:MAG TPA: sulfatase-like hydrolase/transferase, partial [Pirellulaceae bacterium]|nr:sulfatase-like hydrolase/transferase [Pirellulaceae bacterium]